MARNTLLARPGRSRRFVAGAGVVGVSMASAVVGLSSTPAHAADVERLSGSDRIATAIAIYESDTSLYTPGYAMIARSDDYADALVAGAAAAAAKAPLFLTPSGDLDDRVVAALKKHGIRGVAIIGGTKALSPEVETQLTAAGLKTLRVAGTDRYDTARKVAESVLLGTKRTSSPVFLATGTNFADALAAVPPAYKNGAVILLSANRTLDAATAAYLSSDKTTRVVSVGGPAVAAAKAHGVNASPVVGGDRYETATLLARQYFPQAKKAYLASGTVFADAMAGGPLAALNDAPILMTMPTVLPTATREWLDAANVPVTVLGGPMAVSADLLAQVRKLVGSLPPSTSGPSAPSSPNPSPSPSSPNPSPSPSSPNPSPSSPSPNPSPSSPSPNPSPSPSNTNPPPLSSNPLTAYSTLRTAALASTRTATLDGTMNYGPLTARVTATGSPNSDVITATVSGATFKRAADGSMTINASAAMWRTTPWASQAGQIANKDHPVTAEQVRQLTGLPATSFTMRGLLGRVLTANGPFGTELTSGSVTPTAITGRGGSRVGYANGLPTSATDGENQSVTIAWR